MPSKRNPRRGSLQFWPRKRASRAYAKVRSTPETGENKPIGFAGYKVGMTHVTIDDKRPHIKRDPDLSIPVTILECPPLKIASIRFYKKNETALILSTEIMTKPDKEMSRKISLPKKESDKLKEIESKIDDYADIKINVYTQPKLTKIGKKKPELFELTIGGDIKQKLEYAKINLGKEILLKDIINAGQRIDVHSVTKGKGYQGTVKRYGTKIKQRKSEKTKRGVGNLGAWTPKHVSWKIPQPGKMGYHLRTEYNKWVMLIGEKPEEINPKDGFSRYGLVKNDYMLVKGSISGAKKRLIRFNVAQRKSRKIPKDAPNVKYVSLESKQG